MDVKRFGNPIKGFRYVVDGIDVGDDPGLTEQLEKERLEMKNMVENLRIGE